MTNQSVFLSLAAAPHPAQTTTDYVPAVVKAQVFVDQTAPAKPQDTIDGPTISSTSPASKSKLDTRLERAITALQIGEAVGEGGSIFGAPRKAVCKGVSVVLEKIRVSNHALRSFHNLKAAVAKRRQ